MTTTIGVLGGTWRAQVTAWGDVDLGDGRVIGWHVAADDRWHSPADEATVRQVALDGTPVLETKVRIPGGDAIQRVWAVADHGGMTVIEVENDSSMPIAVALTGGGLLTSRPPANVPIEGIDLPADTIVLPVGHRTRVRAAFPHERLDRLPEEIAGPGQVAGGWLVHAYRASRVVLPTDGLADALVAARCALALDGPDAADDGDLLLGIGELVRLGEQADPWVLDVVEGAQRYIDGARRAKRRRAQDATPPHSSAPLWAAAGVLAAAGEIRGAADTVAAIARLGLTAPRPAGPPTTAGERTSAGTDRQSVAVIDEIEGLLARPTAAGECAIFPTGIPSEWWGQSFECHGLRAGPAHSLSFALRWHGERPAILWEVAGPRGLLLTGGAHDPSWSSVEPTGEALLVAPSGQLS
jgi:hypothetical protein